ncbi:MAG: hypothetical protein GWP14_04510 [Actinobacteria bacterium]|nr:hypothetical protein [Actinomycetota bacterium]
MTILRLLTGLTVIMLAMNSLPAAAQYLQTEPEKTEAAVSTMLSNLAQCDAHCKKYNIQAVVSLLDAARRLDATNYKATELLAESLQALGDIQAAAQALDEYVAMQPEDEVALAKRISLGLENLQTSEDRQMYLWRLANQAQIPSGVRGVIYQELARLSLESADEANARGFLNQAIKVDKYALGARQKMLEMLTSQGVGTVPRVGLLAQMVAINPLRLQIVWDFAKGLDELGLHKEAQKWYKYALGVHLAGAGDTEVGSEELLDMASSYVLSKDYSKAMLVLNRISAQNGQHVGAYVWMARATSGLGQTEQAQKYLDAAERLLLQRAQGNSDNTEAAKQLAWFYLQDRPNAAKAMEWAQKAVDLDAEDSQAQLRLGLALLANGKIDEAQVKLEPLSKDDPWARLGLLRILVAGDHTPEQAQQAFSEALGSHFGGWVGLATRELARAQNVDIPIEQALAQLQSNILSQLGSPAELRDFYRHPQDYLYLKLQPNQASFNPGEPILLNISLTNMGSLTITMGPGMMIEPRIVLSARLSGGLQKELKYYDFVSLYKKRALGPGEGISSTVRLDRGELRKLLRANPQEAVTIRVSCILDPQAVGQDEYLPSLGGQMSKEVVLVRHGFRPGPQAMQRLYGLLKNGPLRDRIASAVILGDLMANMQSPTALPQGRTPRTIDDQKVTAELIKAAKTSDWRVRAWLGEALRNVRLTPELSKALAEQIRDPHWFVRFMAVRAAGERGAGWQEILKHVAQTDPDELVRQMAVSYVGPAS